MHTALGFSSMSPSDDPISSYNWQSSHDGVSGWVSVGTSAEANPQLILPYTSYYVKLSATLASGRIVDSNVMSVLVNCN